METEEREAREAEAKAMKAVGDRRWARRLVPVKASRAFREVAPSMEAYMVHLGFGDWERAAVHNAETEAWVYAAAGIESTLDEPTFGRNGLPSIGGDVGPRVRKARATIEPAIARRVARGEEPLTVIRSVLNAFTADHGGQAALQAGETRRTRTIRSKADRTLDSSLATLDGVVMALEHLPVDNLGTHIRVAAADQIHEAQLALRRLETRFREGDNHA